MVLRKENMMYGILSYDDIELIGHGAYKNYRMALYNHFGKENFKEVRSHFDRLYNHADNLAGISHLFIIDEHQVHNNAAWKKSSFIEEANSRNIKVIIFNFEKIFNSSFPWNATNQKSVEQFKNHYQFIADIEDAKILKKTILTKTYLSKDTILNVQPCDNKLDRILFIGQLAGDQYARRRMIVDKFRNMDIGLDILQSDRKFTYEQFLSHINSYKYALSPLGTGQFLSLRYYETIHMDTIPIQEVTDDILKWYPEIKDECIWFKKDDDNSMIIEKIKAFEKRPAGKYFIEDYIKDINLNRYM
jgi:hypothetical protein